MAEVIIIDNGEATSSKKWRWLWVLFVIVLIITVGIGGFVVWALNPTLEIDQIAYDAIESSDNITVTDRAWLAFLPHTPPETGLIIYPGARVPPVAFAPLARQVAENGYLVVIAYPPINLALLNPTMATPIMEHFSGVEHWVVGGHSLGGSVAGSYSADHPELVDGLVLLGAYPINDELLNTTIPIISIYGTDDGLVTPDEIEASRAELPTSTIFVPIEGGNHSQFGYYGLQNGDNPAGISREAQIEQSVNAILRLMSQVDSQN